LQAGLSQADLARRAGVSQSMVSRIECGRLAGLDLGSIEAVAAGLGAWLHVELRWRGSQLDRLLDARHARLVGLVAEVLIGRGWQVALEYSFNHFGERGSVDVLAWHPERRALLLVEVKTRIVDLQDLLASMHRKRRVVPGLLTRERGWKPGHVGSVLVLPDATVHRSAVARHSSIFDVELTGRTRDVARWLDLPESELRAIWFVRDTPTVTRRGDFSGQFRLKRGPKRSGTAESASVGGLEGGALRNRPGSDVG
jgi:transcriptional regulator with XRE-family HTH domain